MSNYDNSLHIVYNSELYNFIEIKNELIKKGIVLKLYQIQGCFICL